MTMTMAAPPKRLGEAKARLASSSPVPFSSRQNSRSCLAPGPRQADFIPAAHRAVHGLPFLPPPENRGGGAAATASSTAMNCASMVPGQPSGTAIDAMAAL
jgi:hypothetical protein